KLLVEEAGSELAAELWDGCDAAVASRLAYPEVRAALAAASRNHDLGDHDLDAAEQAREGYWAATRPSGSPQPSSATPVSWPPRTRSRARMPSTSPAPWPSPTRTSSSPSGTGGCTRGHDQPAFVFPQPRPAAQPPPPASRGPLPPPAAHAGTVAVIGPAASAAPTGGGGGG